jgi:hypothetical protein
MKVPSSPVRARLEAPAPPPPSRRRFAPLGWHWFGWTAGSVRPRRPSRPAAVLALARPRRLRRGGRRSLLWALVLFALTQLVLNVVIDRWQPRVFESIWRFKWGQFLALAAHAPDRPLVVMLGSSRTDGSFQAGRLNGRPGPDGRPLLAYNLGVPAAGPLHEWLYLSTLLDEGIRPRLVLVEFLPPLLNERLRGFVSEDVWTSAPWLSAGELVRLLPYFTRPVRKGREWLQAHVAPAYAFRAELHTWFQGVLDPKKVLPDCTPMQDEWGCRFPESATAQQRRFRLWYSHHQYGATLKDFRPGRGPVRALRDLLGRCRREGIPVALVIMPEASVFRSWYSPRTRQVLQRLLAEMHETYGAEIIDANRWLPDEYFVDGHHMIAAGAAAFSVRLCAEVERLLARTNGSASRGPCASAPPSP